MMGRYFEKQNNHAKAIQLYRRAALSPATADAAVVGLVRSLTSSGELKEASEIAQEHLQKENPFQLDLRVAFANVLLQQEKHGEALRELSVADRIRPGYAPAVEVRSNVFFAQKEFQKAADLMANYLRSNPEATQIRYLRGQALAELKRMDQAITEMNRVAEERPNQLDVFLSLADIHLELKDTKNAEIRLRQASRIAPNDVEVLQRMATLLEALNKNEEAITYFKKILDQEPNNFGIGMRLGNVYTRTNQLKLAEDEYMRMIRLEPGFQPASEGLVDIWNVQRRVDRAGVFLKEYTERWPERQWAFRSYAKMLMEIEQGKLAEQALATAVRNNNPEADTLVYLSWAQNRNGKVKKALETLSDAAEKFPENYNIVFNQGVLMEGVGEADRAIAFYKRIPETAPQHVKARVNLSLIYEKNGNFEEALGTLKSIKTEGELAEQIKARVRDLQASGRGESLSKPSTPRAPASSERGSESNE